MATLNQAVLALVVGLASTAHGATPYPNTEGFGRDVDPKTPWFQECLRVKQVQPPAAPAAPASCKAFDYYAKRGQLVTSAAEWGGVRACAVAASDNGVLAMLYANGLGVVRNLDVATLYACRAGGAYREVQGRIEHLQALQTSPPGTSYDQCDDITSGFMMGICASIGDQQADKIRNAYLARLRTQLPAPQVAAFDQLIAATNAFAKARGDETDVSGTARGMLVVQAEAREKEWLREHLYAFEKGTFKAAPQPLTLVDAELNRAYKALMSAPATDQEQPDRLAGSTVTRSEVRAAQRLWLTYRDSWVRFAALRYPALPADTLTAILTDWRVKQLQRM
jgi:uncharacterized protein YecT (DUF1311 family)